MNYLVIKVAVGVAMVVEMLWSWKLNQLNTEYNPQKYA